MLLNTTNVTNLLQIEIFEERSNKFFLSTNVEHLETVTSCMLQ